MTAGQDVRTCERCERPITTQSRPIAGARMHHAKGLCSPCYHAVNARRVPGSLPCGRRRDTEPDWAVVQRLMHGEHIASNASERRAAAEMLHRRGESIRSIAIRLGAAERTVCRYLRRTA